MSTKRSLTITVDAQTRVSGLLQVPPRATACFVFAHGAGAGMTHPFMAAVADGLAERGIATPALPIPLHGEGQQAARPAAGRARRGARGRGASAARTLPGLPLIAGGKSFGGRMTSQAQALAPLRRRARARLPRLSAASAPERPPASAPSISPTSTIPMLFLQGTRDELAELSELEPVCKALGGRATLKLFADADHSFHVPARTGRKDAEVRAEMLDAFAEWAGARQNQPRRLNQISGMIALSAIIASPNG